MSSPQSPSLCPISARQQIPFALLTLLFITLLCHASLSPPYTPLQIASLLFATPLILIAAFTWLCICLWHASPLWLYRLTLATVVGALAGTAGVVFWLEGETRTREMTVKCVMWPVVAAITAVGMTCVGEGFSEQANRGGHRDVEAAARESDEARKSGDETVFGEEGVQMFDFDEELGDITSSDGKGYRAVAGDEDEEDSAFLHNEEQGSTEHKPI